MYITMRSMRSRVFALKCSDGEIMYADRSERRGEDHDILHAVSGLLKPKSG